MRVVESRRHIFRDLECVLDAELLLPVNLVPEGVPFHIRHHVVEELLSLTRIEERQDMGMLQIRGRLDLSEEALRPNNRSQLRLQDLERNLSLVA